MLFNFLGKPLLGLTRGWWLLIVISLAISAYLLAGLWLDRTIDTAKEAGASAQREANLTETVTRIQEAKNAEAKLDTDPDARRAGCVRHSRTPENC